MKKIPSPGAARSHANLRAVDIAASAGISLQTVLRCESSGLYPPWPPYRERYLAALGLWRPGQPLPDRTGRLP